MIVLCLADDGPYSESIKKFFPDLPVVFTSDVRQVKNWLPLVDVVFVHHMAMPWVSSCGFQPHNQIILVIPETPNASVDVRHTFKNIREAKIKDVYLLSEPDDVQALQARLTEITIEEKP